MSLSVPFRFRKAVPVWGKKFLHEMNRSVLCCADLAAGTDADLYIAGQTRYRVCINGRFFAAGPARAGHGYFRVSRYCLRDALTDPVNTVTILAAGYNVNSYYLTEQEPFLCAEIVSGEEVLFATGEDTAFRMNEYPYRVQKTQRYSFQRPFTESYILPTDYHLLCRAPSALDTVVCGEKKFIERGVPYQEYKELKAVSILSRGILLQAENPKKFNDRSLTSISSRLKGFPEKELESCTVNEVYGWRTVLTDNDPTAPEPVQLGSGGCAVYDMGKNTTGYIRLSLTAERDCVVYAVFNEILPDGVPDPGRDGCANVVKWVLQGGRAYDLVSFEPYTYRYIQIISMYAPVLLTNVSQYRECYRESLLCRRTMPTPELQKIYDAAIESFVQNATDIFMDCPSRERAGWLCDSFFTSRVEYTLTGSSPVERNFLENFILPEKFDYIPDGVLPMCYPADHIDGVYIPNWAMWYVLEAREYLSRSGDRELIDAARARLLKLAAFFEQYENSDGLLQDLDSWVFVEWSQANEFTQDINYPSNMLYSMFLDALSEMYALPALHEKAEKLRAVIREKSFDGTFFRDNDERDLRGRMCQTENHTETCQYYAFFSRTATPETYPELWEKMVCSFGPDRDAETQYPDVPPANAFIGNYLRLELLCRAGYREKVKQEIEAFFLPMAEKTGTLWENMTDHASCNHGFASHVICWLHEITDGDR